jgi:hypothetical protein
MTCVRLVGRKPKKAFSHRFRTFFVVFSRRSLSAPSWFFFWSILAHNAVGLTQVASLNCPAEGGKASSVTLWMAFVRFASLHFARVDYLNVT